MSAKIITYDLRKAGQDYTNLIKAIKEYSNCQKITESCWAINSDDTPNTIYTNLNQYLDTNDRIFVATLTGAATWRNSIGDKDKLKTILES